MYLSYLIVSVKYLFSSKYTWKIILFWFSVIYVMIQIRL